jgi:hypothetical protein
MARSSPVLKPLMSAANYVVNQFVAELLETLLIQINTHAPAGEICSHGRRAVREISKVLCSPESVAAFTAKRVPDFGSRRDRVS